MGDGGEGAPVGLIYYLSVYSFSYLFCEGDSYPGLAHSALLRAMDSLVCDLAGPVIN
jgi:hypothetical protein